MAWYRAGGGGIPSSLKTGMNSVLNKKFGTSTTYDPAGWPSDVNLLGPLPEKTVSGAIASFSDGADDVPCKSVKCSIVASGGGGTPSQPISIVGVSSLTARQRGKNLLDITDVYDNGYWNTSGTWVPSSQYSAFIVGVKPETTYTISGNFAGIMTYWDKSDTFISGVNQGSGFSKTFTTPSNCYYIKRSILTASIDGTQMLEVGSSATTYEAYNAIADVTVALGQTVYGGEYDFTNGTLTVTWGHIASYNGETLTGRWISSMDTYVAGTTPTTGAEVAYELATPTVITGLTAHDFYTVLGDNDFYSDSGDTEVEYRADIALAMAQLQGSRGLMMATPPQTEENEEQEER